MHKYLFVLSIVSLLVLFTAPVRAQTPTPPPGPIYIVQEGDTLWEIAARFNVDVDELISANGLTSTNIFLGDQLIIPGYEGLSGILTTLTIPYGETLRSLIRQYRLDEDFIRKLNHITSPTELYAGYTLIYLEQDNKPAWKARTNNETNETLLELSIKQDTDPWTIATINNLPGTWAGLTDEVLYLPDGKSFAGPSGLPSVFTAIDVNPLPFIQGITAQITVRTNQQVSLDGFIDDRPLHFFLLDEDTKVALQGIYAMKEPGLYPLRVNATTTNGLTQSFEQMILVSDGYYPKDPVLFVEPSTIDPAVTEPENAQIESLTKNTTNEKYWQGPFQLPVDQQYCIRSKFGNRRSYNDSDYIYFHAGIDFGVCSDSHPFDIYAPASGIVIFTGLLTVRGNATIIDHGWGVYSGLCHQEEIYVSKGDHVETGQLIGKIGETGRVNGPHLHWELWVNGIQVNPMDWLNETFPR